MAPSRAFIQAFSQLTARTLPPRAISYSLLQPRPIPPIRLGRTFNIQLHSYITREFSTETTPSPEAPDYLSESELRIFNKLKTELNPTKLEVISQPPSCPPLTHPLTYHVRVHQVQDISGGCGSMYGIEIVSPKFTGIPVIKQHRLVNQVLEEEIKNWHGIQLKTRAV